ncbi:MAG: RdgB/HAM1 family non-canonical purine NTP pyrophosphatase [Thaumarchaeota archaeon]|nr:RdgB/HAM1 family non-canonical purine NTP pyrophosphatase [Nitrososphaerales archaeon]NSL75344.1 RdgB/HAM1 family non-canonical purine NTP pyrophosphatase [Nitrososphaerota archaeon]
MTNKKINLATKNMDKYEEMRNILDNYDLDLRVVDLKGTEIQAFSVLSVAEHSAKEISTKTDEAFIVEDSGVYINSLYGFPGPYSAFVYKTIGLGGIVRLLRNREDKTAEFHSAIVYGDKGKVVKSFIGICEGNISTNLQGDQGFSYDPIFTPKGKNKTFAEMSLSEKNQISHRSKAARTFAEWLEKNQ